MLGKRYEVRRLIGEGGMGSVFGAYDRLVDQEVAIKSVREDLDGGDAGLRDELVALHRVVHPSVLRTYNLEEDGGRRFIVMELLRGKTLAARLHDGVLPLDEVIRIGDALLGALAAAHAQGVTHRDVKPSNLFLCDDARVILLDFGLARPSEVASARSSDGRDATQLAGTPGFMAPEVIAGGRADARADAYAAGVVLYEMVTGKHPYDSEELEVLLMQHRTAPVPDPRGLRADLPAWLARVITALLHKDPALRPRLEPGLLRPPSARRWPGVAAIVALALVAAGLAVWSMRGSAARTPAPPPVLRQSDTEAQVERTLATLITLPGRGNGCAQLRELLVDGPRLAVTPADLTMEVSWPRLRQLLADPAVQRRLGLLRTAATARGCAIYPTLIAWPAILISYKLAMPSLDALAEHAHLARFHAAELARAGQHEEAVGWLRDLVVVGWQLQDERLLLINLHGISMMVRAAEQLVAMSGEAERAERWRGLIGLVRGRKFDEYMDLFGETPRAFDDAAIARLASIADSPGILRGARGEAMSMVSLAHVRRPGAPPPTAAQRQHLARWAAIDDAPLAEMARICARSLELDQTERTALAAELAAHLAPDQR
ncbi:MAG: serine/threonine protein kinase [Deltaproteobacteria bacterium]|nr:serine/threonine protein kinase [Deltaproteobacteria bacterium]MDQ3295462.1 serine/threonine protein kinase [Myxococcota bacterium]